jgi:hypothetical protein
MASTSLTFRCPTEVLEAIDNLGKERYPAANTKHGCDRSKTLIDIMRAGIEALNDGSVVLPAPAFVRQQPDDVRQNLSDNLLEARITEIVQRQTEPLFAEKFSALEERLEKLSAARDRTNDESLRQQLKQTQEQLATANFELDATNQKLSASEQQLAEVAGDREEPAELKQNSAPAIDLSSRAGDIVNFFRTLLPKDTKLPKNTMSKLREILEATED